MTSFGRAGGSLDHASFASSPEAAAAGRDGEILTGRTLDRLANEGGFTVFHDLRIPGAKANIDHIVVAGKQVWVIDSKLWKPGFYWTFGGKTRRGLELVPHTDKRGLPFGHERIAALLGRISGLRPRMENPLMVIHPSRTSGRVSTWAFRPASSDTAKVRATSLARLRFPARAADPRIVAALAPLIN